MTAITFRACDAGTIVKKEIQEEVLRNYGQTSQDERGAKKE